MSFPKPDPKVFEGHPRLRKLLVAVNVLLIVGVLAVAAYSFLEARTKASKADIERENARGEAELLRAKLRAAEDAVRAEAESRATLRQKWEEEKRQYIKTNKAQQDAAEQAKVTALAQKEAADSQTKLNEELRKAAERKETDERAKEQHAQRLRELELEAAKRRVVAAEQTKKSEAALNVAEREREKLPPATPTLSVGTRLRVTSPLQGNFLTDDNGAALGGDTHSFAKGETVIVKSIAGKRFEVAVGTRRGWLPVAELGDFFEEAK